MRVLHFYSTYYPDTFGGAEQAIFQICESVRVHGIESTVLAISHSPNRESISLSNHKVVQTQLNLELASTRFSWNAIIQFIRLSKAHDLVNFHFPWPFADLCQLISRSRTPYVITYHSDIVKQQLLAKLYSPLMHHFLDGAKVVIATSEQYARSSEVLQKYSKKISVVPLALDPKIFAKPSLNGIEIWRKKLPKRFYLFIGVLRYYKGLHLLIEAARGASFEIIIAGSGPLEAQLKTLAIGLQNVRFVGKISEDDKAALLQLAYGYTFPSHLRSEAFGMSLLEASAYSLPMVTLEIDTGSSLINQNGVTGLVVSKYDQDSEESTIKALRLALLKIWMSPDLAAAMGRQAKHRFDTLFRSEIMGERYTEIYRGEMAGDKSRI